MEISATGCETSAAHDRAFPDHDLGTGRIGLYREVCRETCCGNAAVVGRDRSTLAAVRTTSASAICLATLLSGPKRHGLGLHRWGLRGEHPHLEDEKIRPEAEGSIETPEWVRSLRSCIRKGRRQQIRLSVAVEECPAEQGWVGARQNWEVGCQRSVGARAV